MLQFGGVEVLRGLSNFVNMDRPEHHSIDGLKEGSGQQSTLQGRERSVFMQTNIGTKNYYFQCKTGETTERRDGARMGLSE